MAKAPLPTRKSVGQTLIPAERVEQAILFLRGQKVMLDNDLADLYGVETRVLVQAVRRNKDRFPKDFMFRLTRKEFADLKSQSVITRGEDGLVTSASFSGGRGGR